MSTPAKRIRVLVVDDSAVVRRLVTDALSTDPEIEVVGTAMDPYAARDKLKELQPDVLTLDIEMPKMDGLTFLQLLMDHKPMPVIIMSSLTQRGSITALEALRCGAIDVLGKPSGASSFGNLGPLLIEKVKAASIAKVRRRPLPPPEPAEETEETPPSVPHGVDKTPGHPQESARVSPASRPAVTAPTSSTATPAAQTAARPPVTRVVSLMKQVEKPPIPAQIPCRNPRALILLGASTGGTEALTDILTALPNALPPIAIVQHIPPHFSAAFAQRLNRICQLEVREAVDGDWLQPGLALIAPGNFHMLIQRVGDRYKVRVTDGPLVWHQRPAVDLLFKSAIEHAPNVLAGVFTGMGKDGAEGLLRLREKGASTFSQDEASCVVYGMPKAAWENGGSQKQLPLDKSAEYIVRTTSAMSPIPRA